MQSSTNSNELVYGGTSTVSDSNSSESRVMSEKVQIIVSSIYREFELMIQKYGQDSIKDLMSMIVNVLENLDMAYLEKEELVVDLEMLKEENEQLLNQYERERQMRKNQDQKCLEIEETFTEQIRELESKTESMASIVRMIELKSKNASDHATRLEEREVDQKIEYEKLHERYNELLRTHIEHVERTKFLMGTEMFDMVQTLPINPKSNRNVMAMSAVDTNVRGISDLISAHMSQSTHGDLNLANHISNERDWHEEFGNEQTVAEILETPREEERKEPIKNEAERTEDGNLIKPEDSTTREDGDGLSLGADLTGMGKEVENLIRENTELLETKNALNIVKNDLIARVDELSSEQEVFREDVRSFQMVKLKLTERIRELESELKELREKMNSEVNVEEQQEDRSQGKRFTRIEMARMVMEKNQYKEKFLELQETVKFTELKRAKKQEEEMAQRRNKSIWSFFSNLLGDSAPTSSVQHQDYSQKKVGTGQKKPHISSPNNSKKCRTHDIDMDLMKEKRMAERRQHYKTISQYMKQEEFPNAYGWSMSSSNATESASIPVPVNCRPLVEQIPSLKIWCATSSALHGGFVNGEYISGDPILSCDPHLLLRDVKPNGRRKSDCVFELLEASSLMWVCGSNEQRSFVTVLDANQPSSILENFSIDDANILCVSGVAGIHERDSRMSNEGLAIDSELCIAGGYMPKEKIPSDLAGDIDALGTIEFISLQKSKEHNIPTFFPLEEKVSPKRTRDFSVSFADETSERGSSQNIPANGKPTLHRTTAIPLQDEDFMKYNENGAKEKLVLGGVDDDNVDGKKVFNLPLHIRDSLKLYENCADDTLMTLPTMWIGLENFFIEIHSAVRNWNKCLRRIKMLDAVLSIRHLNGSVFAALANGSIAVFHRNTDGEWAENGYFVVKLGAATNSVCDLCVVEGKLWAAYRNCVIVLDPVTLKIEHIITAHPRKDSQVRQMVCTGNGVWLSIRLDSCIRLFHSQTFQHLQDIDVEPFITKMLGTNKLDFLHLRITSLNVLNRRVWVGTGSGIIVSIPMKGKVSKLPEVERGKAPGQVVRIHSDGMENDLTSIPYCDMANAQLSFHGHKDAVRFLLPLLAEGFSDLTQSVGTKKVLIISGGDGYIDYRLGEEEEEENAVQKDHVRVRDLAHLLIWETEWASDSIP